ncbi:EF-hand [Flagelloscypha sp. PMI_526]|nr:EF-hand [Flagelloscypha sp. PMI_526]
MSYNSYGARAPSAAGGHAPNNYGAPPPAHGGYGAPPPGGGYGGPPPPGPPPGHGGGGYPPQGSYGGPPQGPPPPPGADPQLWTWFTSVDADRSGHITVSELERALINGLRLESLSTSTPSNYSCPIFDTDRSGTIGFNEFSGLWKYIKDWQNVFRHFDADRSGSIDGRELDQAMRQFGYNLSPQLLDLVQKKYDVRSAAGVHGHQLSGPPPGITFDRFVRACVVVKQLSEAFQKLDTNRSGWIQIDYNTFMNTVLSLP